MISLSGDKYDFIIVGTGFASTFFLKKVLEKGNESLRILVLERGVIHSHSKRLEIRRSSFEAYEKISKGYNTYSSASDKPWLFDPNFGGSSNCWTGCTPRFMPNDFRLKSTYGVGSDWPISYDDLANYYDEAELIMNIAGPDNTPYPKSGKYPQPPHKLTKVDELLQEQYGSAYISQPAARASVSAAGRSQCCSSGVCNLCPVNAKFTIENGYKNLYEDERVKLEFEAQVLAIEIEGALAKGVTYLQNGEEKRAFADTVVLGANAIFNAHILLNSGDDNPFTGKGLVEQVGTFARIYYNGLNSVGGTSVISANGYMMYDGPHRAEYAGALIESWNTPFIRNEVGRWREMSLLKFVYEDLPQDKNFVTKSDDPGKPEVVFTGYSEYVTKALEKLPEEIEKYFGFLPIEKIEVDGYTQATEGHICGTTRMGNSSDSSVIDSNMIHHKFRNVLVLGSSAYPTCSPANPTLTLSAMSLRAAEKYTKA